MGKKKGSWRKFFCCAGPPETQSSTCININESDHSKHPLEPDLEQEDEDLYIEAEAQTSNVEIPEGNRWRWSRLHNEVEVQTSRVSLPIEAVKSASEMDAEMQTSFLSLPREVEAQAQTSFLSLRSPAPFETEAQVRTSFTELLRESWTEAQVQTSLLSMTGEREAQVQTSLLSMPREMEAQVQTSLLSMVKEREAQVQTSLLSMPREMEAQVQTSLLSMPREREAQVQTLLLSMLREKEAQLQTSLLSMSREREAQVQTSLLSLPGERETQVQTSLLALPGERETQVQTSFLPFPERQSVISVQAQPSYLEVLEKIASLPMFVEAQVQTSNLSMPHSESDIQIQTSFSDMSEKEETSSIETEQQSNRSPSQLSETDFSTLYPLYTNAEAQTLPVEIPPGNDWRSARLKAAAQVQTSNISLEKSVSLLQGGMLQPSKLKSEKSEMLAEELESPLAIKENILPSKPMETGIQTSGPEIQGEDKQSLSQHYDYQFQPSTIELLKKLSFLSQIETMESTSRTELLKKVSSLSVNDPQAQTSIYELQRKPSALSDSAAQGQVLNVELLKERLSSAQVTASSDYERAGKLLLPSPAKEVQIQTSDPELMKMSSSSHTVTQGETSEADLRKYSSLSLIEAMDGNQEEITEGREYLITPQLIESQIRKWYHEFPEVQTASQAPARREPLLSLTADSEVQTSSFEIPQGNRWRASRLQANAEVQTSEREPTAEEVKPCHQSWDKAETQTSLLDIWRSRDLADAQFQTSDLGLATTEVEPPPPLVMGSHVQSSLFDIWKANPKADVPTQTSATELPKQTLESPPTQQIDRPAQTSFLEIFKSKEPGSVQQEPSEFLRPKEENSPLQTDLEVQTYLLDMWRKKEKTDSLRVQTSLLEIPDAQEELPLSSQTDAVVQTSDVEIPAGSRWRETRLHADAQLQTSILDVKEAELESPPPSQMDTQVQTSLLEILKTKDLRDAQAQTSQMDMPKSLGEQPLPSQTENVVRSPTSETAVSSPPSQVNTEVQTSFLDIWKTKEVSNSLAQTSQIDMPRSLGEPPFPSQPENVERSPTSETAESSPPPQINTEVQTSFLDIWKTKEVSNSLAQTSQMDMSKSVEELLLPQQPENVVRSPTSETAESSPPSQIDTEVQTSFLDIWKKKEVINSLAQTSQIDMPKSLGEPPLPSQPENVVRSPTSETAKSSPPSQVNNEVQTSFLDIWKTKEVSNSLAQTSQMDMSKSVEELLLPPQPENVVRSPTSETAESSPPSQIDTEVQTSFLDIWKKKEVSNSLAQTSQMDMPKSFGEPPLPSQPENVVRSPTSETAKSSPPSQVNTEVQTSFLDIWKNKEVSNSMAQTSWMDMPKSLGEPSLPSQPENAEQSPTSETAESSPPPQIDTEVQTSFLDIWKTKEVSNSLAQTSQMDMSKSVEELLLPPQPENVVQSPTPEITKSPLPSQADTEAQTSFFDIWKAKELSNAQMQTSWLDLPESMEEPLLQSQSESPMQIVTPESPPPNQLRLDKKPSLLEMWKAREPLESSEMPRSSPSPTGTEGQTSQLDTQTLEELPSPWVLSSKGDLAGATREITVLPRTASPGHLPLPANTEAALLAQTDPQLPASLLEVWTTRQEAEVQMQTASLGLSFDKNSPLFPIVLEKRLEPISKVEGKSKPPIFTEAQVQTSFVEIPRGKKWRSSRLCTEAQVQTSFPDLRSKDRVPACGERMGSDHKSAKRVPKGPKRATPVSVHLHVKMSPKRRTSNEKE